MAECFLPQSSGIPQLKWHREKSTRQSLDSHSINTFRSHLHHCFAQFWTQVISLSIKQQWGIMFLEVCVHLNCGFSVTLFSTNIYGHTNPNSPDLICFAPEFEKGTWKHWMMYYFSCSSKFKNSENDPESTEFKPSAFQSSRGRLGERSRSVVVMWDSPLYAVSPKLLGP